MISRGVGLAIIAAVLLILSVGVASLYLVRSQVPPTAVSPTASPFPSLATPSPTLSPTDSPTATPLAVGAITGRFGYGSDFIPPVTVYAISTTDPRVWYSVNYAGVGNPPRPTPQPGTSGDTYTITGIAPGTYWVVAYRNDGLSPDPGFYSRAAICMRTTPSGPCPDINPVPVMVIAGQTSSGIDVLTWGTQPQPSPTLPPRPTPR
jgi:hypothetical protein